MQLKAFILTEVVSRVVKNVIRGKLREMKRDARESTEVMKRRMIEVVVYELNYILGAHTSTKPESNKNKRPVGRDPNMSSTGPLPDGKAWNSYLKTHIEMKFGLHAPVLTLEELKPDYDLGQDILRVPLLQTLSR